jgi:hypothetical protein
VVIVAASSLPGVVTVTPGDYFELIARQTSDPTKTAQAPQLNDRRLQR